VADRGSLFGLAGEDLPVSGRGLPPTKCQAPVWAQAKEFADRWARVNQAEIDELNATSPEILLRQMDSLRSAVDTFGWREELDKETEEVRNRWNRLRALFGA